MIFTDDTEEALRAAVWLVNSAEAPETLADLGDLDRFLTAFPYTGRLDRDEHELRALRSLRPRLRAMLSAPRDEMVPLVNAALAQVPLAPRLVRHDDTDWHLHAVDDDRPLAERVLIETAMALIDVIRADEGSRISVCDDDTCLALALDLSRNRSKRYCSATCANRNAVAAYRARRAGA
ncbi:MULTISPECIES: CGNR zinc finger domain-containing protein [unclassified Microbacterium]|uniref:CGNR zinc finger domain-containing protein n=1 Tax=unclassified Microbacterium TaxID=2609290 RepID=UPI000EA902B1|nr:MULTISPECIES: CGNR zinc finger domain-containing protein [unclassified Microbacterium]MBT2483674.1 CGNR zinc finger domain-containing protein [Microbacterium sp. ISL-108]RKN66675.1 CGNR zinc finger domain-containing protein [Microbacterium sp. CGR2]